MSTVERVQIDLETLGLRHDAQILSIGAYAAYSQREFYVEIEQGAYDDKLFRREANVVEWWEKRGGFQPTTPDPVSPGTAVQRLSVEFFDEIYKETAVDDVEVWANSPSFDLEMLRYHYRMFMLGCPWEFWQERDFRTLRALQKQLGLPVARATPPHHALEDAKLQAYFVENVMLTLQRDRQLALDVMRGGGRFNAVFDDLINSLEPFTHPDLAMEMGGNVEGDNSIVYQRNGAYLKLGDFRRAARALEAVRRLGDG